MWGFDILAHMELLQEEEDGQDGCAKCLRGMSQKARRLARVPKGGWEVN